MSMFAHVRKLPLSQSWKLFAAEKSVAGNANLKCTDNKVTAQSFSTLEKDFNCTQNELETCFQSWSSDKLESTFISSKAYRLPVPGSVQMEYTLPSLFPSKYSAD